MVRPELAAFRPVLERLQADSMKYFGVASPTLHIERYMPRFYSDVVKVAIAHENRQVRAYVKIAKIRKGDSFDAMSARVETVFGTMTRLHQMMVGTPGLSAVRPVAHFPEHLAIVTEEAPGETLLDLLEARAAWWPSVEVSKQLVSTLARVGEWIRRFHDVSTPNPDRLSIAEMREYLDVRLRLLTLDHRVLTETGRGQILAAFDRRASRLHGTDLELRPVHADFAPGNIVVNGTSVTVLDFSVPAYGAVWHDVAHLYLQLDLLTAKPSFRPTVVRALQQALLRGFDPKLVASHALFELLYLQHVVCHLTGLAQNPVRPIARVYNWHVMRRHQRWLNSFANGNGDAQ